MKALIATALMIASFTTFSAEMGAVDSFLSILPLGSYQGYDDAGNRCSVVVNDVSYPAKVLSVTVSNNKATIFKIINDGSEFRFRAFTQEFIQSERQYVDATRESYVDRIIKTRIAGEDTLYVGVANEITVNREQSVAQVECIVSL